jgi:hypothetical protein
MPSKSAWILMGLAGIFGYIAMSALIRHRNLYRFPSIPYCYEPRPQDTVICSRPMDTESFVQHLYPLFKHTYIKTDKGTFGYQFCDPFNDSCKPGMIGPVVLPDRTTHPMASVPENHKCWLVSTDPEFKKCMFGHIENIKNEYSFPNRYFSIFANACATYADRLVERCHKDINKQ